MSTEAVDTSFAAANPNKFNTSIADNQPIGGIQMKSTSLPVLLLSGLCCSALLCARPSSGQKLIRGGPNALQSLNGVQTGSGKNGRLPLSMVPIRNLAARPPIFPNSNLLANPQLSASQLRPVMGVQRLMPPGPAQQVTQVSAAQPSNIGGGRINPVKVAAVSQPASTASVTQPAATATKISSVVMAKQVATETKPKKKVASSATSRKQSKSSPFEDTSVPPREAVLKATTVAPVEHEADHTIDNKLDHAWQGDTTVIVPAKTSSQAVSQTAKSEVQVEKPETSTATLKPINDPNNMRGEVSPKVALGMQDFVSLVEELFKFLVANNGVAGSARKAKTTRRNQAVAQPETLETVVAQFDSRPEAPIPLKRQKLDKKFAKDSVVKAQLTEKSPANQLAFLKRVFLGKKSFIENLISEQFGLAVPTKMIEHGDSSVLETAAKQVMEVIEENRAKAQQKFVPARVADPQVSMQAVAVAPKTAEQVVGAGTVPQTAFNQAIQTESARTENLRLLREITESLLGLGSKGVVLNRSDFTSLLGQIKQLLAGYQSTINAS